MQGQWDGAAGWESGAAGPPPGSNRKPLWIALGCLGLGCLTAAGAVVVLIIAGVAFELGSEEYPPRPADWQAVFSAADVRGWVDFDLPLPENEVLIKTRYSDGSWDLDYEFEAEDEECYVLVSSLLNVEQSIGDARTIYKSFGVMQDLYLWAEAEDIESEARDELLHWGDESEFALLKADGVTYGMQFCCRSGKRVFYGLVTGTWSDDAGDIEALFVPALERFEQHSWEE